MTSGERIKKVRKVLDLTQQEFADRIGSKRNTVATYEMGRTAPSAAVISLVCNIFSVNEVWLRTGEGEMFIQQSKDDELDQVLSAIAASDDELIKRIIRAYWRLDDKEKSAVKKLIDGFSSESSVSAPSSTEVDQSEWEREADEFAAMAREQFLLQKEQASRTSSVKESGLA